MGFALEGFVTLITHEEPSLMKTTGIGGIFLKCKDPEKIRFWYRNHPGINIKPYGAVFDWRQGADTTKKGFTLWSPFNEKTT